MATKIDLSAYENLYNTTASEYLEKMKESLSHLSQTPHDATAIATLYMSAHSLKSQSMVMGFKNTGALCNVIENMCREIQEKQTVPSVRLLELLQESLQRLENSLKSIEKDNQELPLGETIKKLEHFNPAS